ncbi:MAG TPA: hypothetical protein VGY55_13445 [Pirellulales bacterium]|jgi:hypothetical protein|nr:hypothetical protein [Pirellulales bacterium]
MLPDDEYRSNEFPSDLKPFEAALGALVPAASRVDRDRLMYLAGAAGATIPSPARFPRLHRAFWPCATAAMALIALGLGGLLAFRQPQERIVYVSHPAAGADQPTSPFAAQQNEDPEPKIASRSGASDAGYLVLREQVLQRGVDALDVPAPSANGANPSDVRNRTLLKEFLGT